MPSFEDMVTSSKIFKNISVLSPHYIPDELPFRNEQLKEIIQILSPAIRGQKPRNLIIYGKTGTGKTCTIKLVMKKFGRATKKEEAGMHYINCRIYNSRYRIMQKMLKVYVPELEKSGFGLPHLYEKLIETISEGRQLVVVLDEIDMIKDLDELIYTLTRANDEVPNGGVSIVGISNRLSFKDALDPRSRSSLHETEMIFPPYTSEQLREILEGRISGGFLPGVVKQSSLNLAAAITAQESGDARYALKLLLKAGEIAESEKKEKITDEEVESARKRVEIDLTAETIGTLPEMHQIVLYSIAELAKDGSRYSRLEKMEDNVLFSGEVYEKYETNCKKTRKKPRSTRWFREYLNDLEMLGLISTKPSSKGIRGHTTLVKLGQSPENVIGILKKNLQYL